MGTRGFHQIKLISPRGSLSTRDRLEIIDIQMMSMILVVSDPRRCWLYVSSVIVMNVL